MYRIISLQNKQWMVRFTLASLVSLIFSQAVTGQDQVLLRNMDFFQKPGKSWSIVGNVGAHPEDKALITSKGEGVLVNTPSKRNPGKDLYSLSEYGDMDLEFEYMMAPGSNSGVYLQGRYEIQLLDSWGIVNPKAGDNGGIYERWDESRPAGQKGFQGYAPRQNVSRAPGLWQRMEVSFQAPQFDEQGIKTENAIIRHITLNGVLIHENVELFGPTRGGMENNEKAKGPLRIQGDHGAVAFRNIKITGFDSPRPELSGVSYSIYGGRFEETPDFGGLSPEMEGASAVLTSNFSPPSKQYLIRYTGTLDVKQEGEYTFNLNVPGGMGAVTVNNEKVLDFGRTYRKGSIVLPEGQVPLELLYSKYMDWVEPGVGLAVAGPGIREFQLSNSNSVQRSETDPILVDPREKPLLRSFMDIPNHPRVTHAISVGSEAKVHYTYDLDHGSLFQTWRGEFLNATPMWHNRGDGSSRPLGSVTHMGIPVIPLAQLSSEDAAWPADTLGSSYTPKGYKINDNNDVSFLYEAYGASVTDGVSILDNGHGIRREVRINNVPDNAYYLLAQDQAIEEIAEGYYLIGDKAYFLKWEGGEAARPRIRNVAGQLELVIAATGSFAYTLLF